MKFITTFLAIVCYFTLSLAVDSLPQVIGQTTDAQIEDEQTEEAKPTASQQSDDDPKATASKKTNTNSTPAPATQTESTTEATTLVASGANSPQAPKKTFELTFDDLAFEMEKGSKFDRSLLTEKINSYDNNVIKVRGFIRPSFSQSGLKKFIFVRDNKECCFGPGAALYDCILVRLAKGSETDFTVRPVTIQGTFSLKEYQGPDGKVWSIYRMNDTKMK